MHEERARWAAVDNRPAVGKVHVEPHCVYGIDK